MELIKIEDRRAAIKIEDRIVSFPWMGKEYTKLMKQTLENLGLNVHLPPKTTRKTINLGVKNSAEMMCFPYKVTLGNFIESLENGANTLLMWDSRGTCRLRHYHKLHEFTLNHLGYDGFEMYGISGKNLIGTLKKLSGKSRIDVIKEVYFNFPKKLKEYDAKKTRWSDEKPNIGIIGEIYSALDETINYGIENKIKSYGANPFNTVTLTDFIGDNLLFKKFIPFIKDEKKKYKIEASKYLNGKLGGHGFENIYNLLELVDKKVDGVVHLLPLTCMPETTIEPFVNQICKDNRVPLLRIPIDENNSEANLETRIETFVELIKMRK